MIRPRFTLKTMLLAFTLIGLGVGLYGRHLVEQRRQIRLVEAARDACEQAGCSPGVHGDPGMFLLFALDGTHLTAEAATAMGKAEIITRVLLRGTVPAPAEAAMAANFHRAEDYSPINCIWERIGWDVPREILDRRNGINP